MKRNLISLLLAVTFGFLSFQSAEAASENPVFEIDIAPVYASEPAEYFDETTGINIGSGLMLNQNRTVQARLDVTLLEWDQSNYLHKTYERRAVCLSGRYYLPTFSKHVNFISQLGIETSSDENEASGTPKSRNTGITPGLGWQVRFGPNLSFNALVRYHSIKDSYIDAMLALAIGF